MFKLGLPLLEKEFIEQGNSRRNYWFRFFYSTMLIYLFLCIIYRKFYVFADDNSLQTLIQVYQNGHFIFRFLIIMQYLGMVLIVPMSIVYSINREKEKNSFSLLLVTDLSPGTIILEKYFSQIVPILNLQLITFPLAAILYSTGYISLSQTVYQIMFLLTATFFTGALALMFSIICNKSSEALFLTYLIISIYNVIIFRFFWGHPWLVPTIIIMTVLCLISAWKLITEQPNVMAEKKRKINYLTIFIDRIFGRIFDKIIWFRRKKNRSEDPAREPVFWLEAKKGKARNHMWWIKGPFIFLVLYSFFAVYFSFPGTLSAGLKSQLISILISINWFMIIIYLASFSANSLREEKASGNMDLMLISHLTGRQIIRQKLHYLKKMAFIFLLPIFFLLALKAIIFFSLLHCLYLILFGVLLYFYVLMIIHLCFLIGNAGPVSLRKITFAVSFVSFLQLFPMLVNLLFIEHNEVLNYLGKILTPIDSSIILGAFGVTIPAGASSDLSFSFIVFIIRTYVYLLVYFFLRNKCVDNAELILMTGDEKKKSNFMIYFCVFFLIILFCTITDFYNDIFLLIFFLAFSIIFIWKIMDVDLKEWKKENKPFIKHRGKKLNLAKKKSDLKSGKNKDSQ